MFEGCPTRRLQICNINGHMEGFESALVAGELALVASVAGGWVGCNDCLVKAICYCIMARFCIVNFDFCRHIMDLGPPTHARTHKRGHVCARGHKRSSSLQKHANLVRAN